MQVCINNNSGEFIKVCMLVESGDVLFGITSESDCDAYGDSETDEEITEKFTKYFESVAPKSVKVKVMPHHGGEPYVSPTDIPAYVAASKAMETTYGKKPVPVKSGGSIPIVALFEEELGVKSILLGFGLDSDAIHSPNESFGLYNFYMGIETITSFYQNFSKK